MSNFRIPAQLRVELDKSDDWSVERGTRHFHIRIAGQLAGILPFRCADSNRRAMKNIIAQIRRARREVVA